MEALLAGLKHVAVNKQVAECGPFEDLSVFVASVENKLSGYYFTFKTLRAAGGCSHVLLSLFSGRAIQDR